MTSLSAGDEQTLTSEARKSDKNSAVLPYSDADTDIYVTLNAILIGFLKQRIFASHLSVVF
jgi:hypothetical protein